MKDQSKKPKTEDKYPEKTVDQTLSTKNPLYGSISTKGQHLVIRNGNNYEFTLLINLEALERLLTGESEMDFVYVNVLLNDDEDEDEDEGGE